jgi:hypothetical protein
MVDHWRRLRSKRVPRGTRAAAIVGLGPLLAGALLAGLPAPALASAPEVRGEWAFTETTQGETVKGTALVTEEVNAKDEFSAPTVAESIVRGSMKVTLEGSKATVTTTSEPFGTLVPATEFKSSTMTVVEGPSSLSISGEGELKLGTEQTRGTLELIRVKTQKQIEEQQEREKKELEEREARANIRGEWSLTLESGPTVLKGIALVTTEANSKSEFASKSALFDEGILGGTFSGTLSGAEADVTVTTEEAGDVPASVFTGEKITVSTPTNPTSMSGTGTVRFGGPSGTPYPTTFTATRLRSYGQIEEQETKEREAKEKQEKEAQEAKEKAEAEAKAKAEAEAKAKAEAEAKAKAEAEAKAKAEAEAKAKAAREASEAQERLAKTAVTVLPLVSPEPTAKTLTVGDSGSLALGIASRNAYTIQGHVTLTDRKSKKASMSFGGASFTISANGSATVKIKLPSAARAYLAHHKTLHVSVEISTEADGMHSSRTYTITLRTSGSGHHKG